MDILQVGVQVRCRCPDRDKHMLPLSKDRAVELLEHDITVYMLYPDNAEEMVFEAEDIIKHDGMCGVTRPD